MFDKLQKRVCTTVSPTLVASLEPLFHRRNIASSSELAELTPLPSITLIDCVIFLPVFLNHVKISMSTVSSFLAQQEKKNVFHKLRAIKRNENPNPYRRYFCQAATKETLR